MLKAELLVKIADLERKVNRLQEELDDALDYNEGCEHCESVAHDLVLSHHSELVKFLAMLDTAKRPFEGELHIYSVTMWDDQLNDLKELIRKLLKAV